MGALAYTLPPLGGPKHGHFVKATILGDMVQDRDNLLTTACMTLRGQKRQTGSSMVT